MLCKGKSRQLSMTYSCQKPRPPRGGQMSSDRRSRVQCAGKVKFSWSTHPVGPDRYRWFQLFPPQTQHPYWFPLEMEQEEDNVSTLCIQNHKLVLWPRVGAQHQDAIKDHEKKSFEERIILKYCWNPFNKKKKCCHRFQLLTCEDFSQISCGPVVPFHIYSIRIHNISVLMSTLCVFVYI